ncbi:Predicted helicase [Acidaminococcus fermentans]|nr:Predicted helicase [Acidaminococcus fermentans]
MSFASILESYRKMSRNEREKGQRFEILMKHFLKTAPLYKQDIEEVWLWNEFPFRKDFGGTDLGIDLVAKTYAGDYWSIQCKFYQENTTIQEAAVSNFVTNSSRSFQDEQGMTRHFSLMLWIDTKSSWSRNAEKVTRNQSIPFQRLGYYDLRDAEVDWDALADGLEGAEARPSAKKSPREHQVEAIQAAHAYFKNHDRGKLIMACGTGKTYTALNIMETETQKNGFALFLVPSIALLSQTLREWMNDTTTTIYPVCICSDPSASETPAQKRKRVEADAEDASTVDLPFPATTDVEKARRILHQRFEQQKKNGGIVVIFSTYQSIDVVHHVIFHTTKNDPEGDDLFLERNQQPEENNQEPPFDIIVCDEAHRTAGYVVKGKKQSPFIKVHDNGFLPSRRRLYMTATPKLYTEAAKSKADQGYAVLCSMDDEKLYGQEIYHIGFGKAVEKGLLADYKVLVFSIGEDQISAAMQIAVKNNQEAIETDDAAKLIGCINALSKRMIDDETSQILKEVDPNFMHTALAFCSKISASKKIAQIFNEYSDDYYESLTDAQKEEVVHVQADHVDGSMPASLREKKLEWLKETDTNGSDCHILCNVRCLSEGVDVPALDAVIFLSSRNSEVDVVQSVGRVMRTAKDKGKKFGYIIIPVVVPSGVKPEEALNKSKDFNIVWSVLNALRAHDDRFNAHVNQLNLNDKPSDRIIVTTAPVTYDGAYEGLDSQIKENHLPVTYQQLTMDFGNLQQAIYARMVEKVGTRRYWETWGKEVADIARRHVERIRELVQGDKKYRQPFDKFVAGLRKNLNPSIQQEDAINMLAQHIITRPVFDALFKDAKFIEQNPVSRSMEKILGVLDDVKDSNEADRKTLQGFYDEIRQGCEGIDNDKGRQKIITDLYETFFKVAAKTTVEKLGIVYTPIPVVDFILRSVDALLGKEFYCHLTDKNIHILDPFTGTGTFIVRLLQLGLISPEDLLRKYRDEIHANEIVLLAYYIASINIESTYHALAPQEPYTPFQGICLTDTFQLGENGSSTMFTEEFPVNSKRVEHQMQLPIRVIIGNPPYSVGQKSANDNAQNETYPLLEERIADTYAANTKATLKTALYDSYIKAFRWASDRLGKQGGIIGFVSNAGWLDGSAMDGMRKCLEEEFSSIYVFNLRGNARTQGEIRRKERDNVFGQGTRTPVAITLLVKNPNAKNVKADIFYHDIGDYLSREDKLDIINQFGKVSNPKMTWTAIHPNEKHDWLNKRSNVFQDLIVLGDKKNKTIDQTVFCNFYTNGVKTNRDVWCFNFSRNSLEKNIDTTIEFYNQQTRLYQEGKITDFLRDSSKINWVADTIQDAKKGKVYQKNHGSFRMSMYRPFSKKWLFFDTNLNQRTYQLPKLFPTVDSKNLLICVPGIGNSKAFRPFIVDEIPCLDMIEKGQCFPLYYYQEKDKLETSLFDPEAPKMERKSAITPFALKEAHNRYGSDITAEDIFFYVYGFLHLPNYRKQFAADLKKSLPRISFVEKREDFVQIMKIGRALAKLHLDYETQKPPEGVVVEGAEKGNFTVEKIRFGKKDSKTADKSVLQYNESITIRNIPEKVYGYVVNGRSPVEWIMDQYQVKVDKASQLKNDPNDWCWEQGNPRYILDLLLSVMTVSIKTQELVAQLPDIQFMKE